MKILAKDIMTKQVLTISATAKIYELTKLLAENKISGVPVCNEEDQVVGIVSDSDLIALKKGDKVLDIMTSNVIGVSPDNSLEEVATILHMNRIKRVPVFENNQLIGIISRGDIIRALAKEHEE